jgi:hypothetical protein
MTAKTDSFAFVAFTNYGCSTICLNMIRSLLLVCPAARVTLYCTDNKSVGVFADANLPITVIRYEPTNHSTEQYVDYHTKNWNAITEQKYRILLDYMKTCDEPFFYADCDLYFMKSPVVHFNEILSDESVHLVMQTDKPLGHKHCTGAILVRNSTRCREVFETCLNNMMGDDQDTMNAIFDTQSGADGVYNFSPEFCPNGYLFFKSGEVTDPTIVHANFFLGMDQKVNALKSRGLWLL